MWDPGCDPTWDPTWDSGLRSQPAILRTYGRTNVRRINSPIANPLTAVTPARTPKMSSSEGGWASLGFPYDSESGPPARNPPREDGRMAPTTIGPFTGKRCLGHGVPNSPAPSLEHGHYVRADLVNANFSTQSNSTKTLGRIYLHPRCNHCRSIQRWHDNHVNAARRANAWRRQHAQRWVKKGHHTTIDAALAQMDTGGITAEALNGLLVSHVGKPCPGLCAYEEDGQVITHTIGRVADMHLDVRDPSKRFTIENTGVLCVSCNTAKGEQAWLDFIADRHAHLKAWKEAMEDPRKRTPVQGTLFDEAG